MTETEGLMKYGRSTTQTAIHAICYLGRPLAKKAIRHHLVRLLNLKRTPMTAVCFWTAVLGRVTGSMGISATPAPMPEITRRQLDAMQAAV